MARLEILIRKFGLSEAYFAVLKTIKVTKTSSVSLSTYFFFINMWKKYLVKIGPTFVGGKAPYYFT